MKDSNTHCPCCGIFDYEEEIGGTYLICPVCGWEDDAIQLHSPDYTIGANGLSLNQAKEEFKINQTLIDGQIIFMSKPSEFDEENLFVVHIPKINGIKHLFEELSEKLRFPSYFGRNRDAVNDCLSDLMWLDEKDIVIVHDSTVNLNEKDFYIYMDILHDTMLYW